MLARFAKRLHRAEANRSSETLVPSWELIGMYGGLEIAAIEFPRRRNDSRPRPGRAQL